MKLWCDKHYAPFKEGKSNPELADELLRQKLLNSEKFLADCGTTEPTKPLQLRVMSALITKHGGICCFLGDAVVDQIVTQCKVGAPGIANRFSER